MPIRELSEPPEEGRVVFSSAIFEKARGEKVQPSFFALFFQFLRREQNRRGRSRKGQISLSLSLSLSLSRRSPSAALVPSTVVDISNKVTLPFPRV